MRKIYIVKIILVYIIFLIGCSIYKDHKEFPKTNSDHQNEHLTPTEEIIISSVDNALSIDSDIEFIFRTKNIQNAGKLASFLTLREATIMQLKHNGNIVYDWIENTIDPTVYSNHSVFELPSCIINKEDFNNRSRPVHFYFEQDQNNKYILWHFGYNAQPINLYIKKKYEKTYWLQVFDPKTKKDLNASLLIDAKTDIDLGTLQNKKAKIKNKSAETRTEEESAVSTTLLEIMRKELPNLHKYKITVEINNRVLNNMNDQGIYYDAAQSPVTTDRNPFYIIRNSPTTK